MRIARRAIQGIEKRLIRKKIKRSSRLIKLRKRKHLLSRNSLNKSFQLKMKVKARRADPLFLHLKWLRKEEIKLWWSKAKIKLELNLK